MLQRVSVSHEFLDRDNYYRDGITEPSFYSHIEDCKRQCRVS